MKDSRSIPPDELILVIGPHGEKSSCSTWADAMEADRMGNGTAARYVLAESGREAARADTPWTSVAPAVSEPGPLDVLADMDPDDLRALVEASAREAAVVLEENKGVFDDSVTEETMRRIVGGRLSVPATSPLTHMIDDSDRPICGPLSAGPHACTTRRERVDCPRCLRKMDCGSIAPVEQWLKFAEKWAHDADQEGEFGEANGHRTWSEVFEEHLAKRSAQERHEAAVNSVMFQDDSWLPDEKDTESGPVSRTERDGTTTYVAECEGDRTTVTVRGGAAMLTVYDDERNSTADVLIEPVVSTLVAAGIVRDTECRSVSRREINDLADYMREAGKKSADDDADPASASVWWTCENLVRGLARPGETEQESVTEEGDPG